MRQIATSNQPGFEGFLPYQCIGNGVYESSETFTVNEPFGFEEDFPDAIFSGNFSLRGDTPGGLFILHNGLNSVKLRSNQIEDPFTGQVERIFRAIMRKDGQFPSESIPVYNSTQGYVQIIEGVGVTDITREYDFDLVFTPDLPIPSTIFSLRIIIGFDWSAGSYLIPIVIGEIEQENRDRNNG